MRHRITRDRFIALAIAAALAGSTLAAPALASSGASASAGSLTFVSLKKNTRNGTAKVTVKVSAAGTVSLFGKKVKSFARTPGGPATLKLPVRAKGKAKTTLTTTGKVRVRVTIIFTPRDNYTPSGKIVKKIKLVKR